MEELTFSHGDGVIRACSQHEEVGRIEFSEDGLTLTIKHTFAYIEGKGIGRQLVEEAVRLAKIKSLEIKSECSFSTAYLERMQRL